MSSIPKPWTQMKGFSEDRCLPVLLLRYLTPDPKLPPAALSGEASPGATLSPRFGYK